MKPRTHLLFDFFGTLVDYSESHLSESHAASHALLVGHGCELSYQTFRDEWEATFTRFVAHADASLDEFSMFALCGAFLTAHLPRPPATDLVVAFRDTYLQEWSRGVVHIPGVEDMLEAVASRFRLAVVSNTHHAGLVKGLLQEAGLDGFFSNVITSVEHGRRKPCPSIYRHALSVTGGRAETATFVGDSFLHDYSGARGAGLHALLIDPDAEHAIPDEHRIERILDVPERIGA